MITTEQNKLIPLERDSKLQWNGLTSQKFTGSRRHFNYGETLGDFALPSLGRKHYDEKFDRPKPYKSCLKVFPESRNRESHENNQPKKLIYVPAQKKSKPFKLRMSTIDKSGKTSKFTYNNESTKLNWKEKEKIEAMKEDQKSVHELNQWENKIKKLLDPFYIVKANEENDD